MPVFVGDIYRFSLVQRLFLQEVVNTFAFKVEAMPAPLEEPAFLSSLFNGPDGTIKTEFSDTLKQCQVDEVQHIRFEVQRVSPVPGAKYEYALAGVGAIDGTAMTANVAACISRHGAGAGRRERGRIAVAGAPYTMATDGKWTGPYLALLNAFATNLHEEYTAPADLFRISYGYWSPMHNATVNGVPIIYPPLYVKCVSAQARDTVRVQRSRTIGVGS